MTGTPLPECWRALNPPSSAEPFVRSKWLRAFLLPQAGTLAAIEALGGDVADYTALGLDAWIEVLSTAVGTCADLGWPSDLGRVNAEAVWTRARSEATQLHEGLRKRLWRLGVTHAPGLEILAVARLQCDHAGIYVPEPVLLDAARRIALAAANSGRRRRVIA